LRSGPDNRHADTISLEVLRRQGADDRSDTLPFDFVGEVHDPFDKAIANKQVWLPDWGGNSGDTIPYRRGRTVYFGVEFAQNRK
jgi:hypothetical protein